MLEVLFRSLKTIAAVPAFLLLGFLRVYQRIVSPVLPAVFGPACGCRFHPTCSHYAAEAVRTRGALIGSGLTLWRLVRCTPLHPGGFDPVPPPRATQSRTHLRPKRLAVRCARVAR